MMPGINHQSGISHLLITSIVLVLMLSSCTTYSHMPHSELVMFQEKELKSGERTNTRYAHGIASGTFDVSDEGELLSSQTDFDSAVQGPSVATHLIFMNSAGTSFSAAIGNGIGFDATFPVFSKFMNQAYLTQTFSFTNPAKPSLQTIIQRRFYDGNPFGLSVGMNYHFKYNRRSGFEGIRADCPGSSSSVEACHDFIPRHSIGLRSAMSFSVQPVDQRPTKQMLYGAVNLNYDLTFGFIYPMLSVSLVLH